MIRSRLVNGSFGDPLVYCSIPYLGKAFCFDMGASFSLSNAELQRVEALYISHTHMDHIFGFDYFLRANLKRRQLIRIYGPHGIAKNIQGKLRGFTWNLVNGYGLVFEVFEIRKDRIQVYKLKSHEKFQMERCEDRPLKGKSLHAIARTQDYQVKTATLDHRIPSQAYQITENHAYSINKDRLSELKWVAGPWLKNLKQKISQKKCHEESVTIPLVDGGTLQRRVGQLAKEIVLPRERMRIAYVTDAAISQANADKIIELADNANVLYCETAFMQEDRDKADRTRHMTAAETGRLAKEAGCKRLVIFHFGKKYLADPNPLIAEASENFGKKVEAHTYYETSYKYAPSFLQEMQESKPNKQQEANQS